MISLRRLQVVVAHELRLAARDPFPILVLIVFPIITMAFLKPAFRPALVQSGHPHANGAEQVVPGEATMSAFFVVALITRAPCGPLTPAPFGVAKAVMRKCGVSVS